MLLRRRYDSWLCSIADSQERTIAALRGCRRDATADSGAELLGVHLEGRPRPDTVRHLTERISVADRELLRLYQKAEGHIRSITIAPEAGRY